MLGPHHIWALFFAGAMLLGVLNAAISQEYPVKPVRIITAGVGGNNDFASRIIAQGISDRLGQRLIVENRSGVTQGETVAKAPPDGYTLLVTGSSFWTGSLFQKTPYDPVRDFSPISLVSSAPNVLIVHPSLPAKSVRELIALARAKPGELNYSTGNTGAGSHIAMEVFKSMAGVNMVRIPYKSSTMELADLMGGQVLLSFSTGGAVPYIKSGRVRALAVTSLEPTALFPGLPTVTASGVPGYQAVSLTVMLAPARTPDAIIRRLNQEVVRFLNTADAKEQFFNSATDAIGSTPEQLAATIKSELERVGQVVRNAGIVPQ